MTNQYENCIRKKKFRKGRSRRHPYCDECTTDKIGRWLEQRLEMKFVEELLYYDPGISVPRIKFKPVNYLLR